MAIKFHYFIEPGCISCAACWRTAPEHFGSHEIDANAIVVRQPEADEEVERCEEARAICPVRVIAREER